uniref:Uncharacterized protein n=1 Tax=Ornithorhynchus anatinus TaxID=9258 RepID=A0A6I8PDF1_ORNAN
MAHPPAPPLLPPPPVYTHTPIHTSLSLPSLIDPLLQPLQGPCRRPPPPPPPSHPPGSSLAGRPGQGSGPVPGLLPLPLPRLRAGTFPGPAGDPPLPSPGVSTFGAGEPAGAVDGGDDDRASPWAGRPPHSPPPHRPPPGCPVQGPPLVHPVPDPVPLPGLELLCPAAAGGATAQPAPGGLDAAGPLAPRRPARPRALPALLPPRQGGPLQVTPGPAPCPLAPRPLAPHVTDRWPAAPPRYLPLTHVMGAVRGGGGLLGCGWAVGPAPLQLGCLPSLPASPAPPPRTYDAYSTFYLNSDGLICRHRLDKVMPSHSPPAPVKKLLLATLVALGWAEPQPHLRLCPDP